MGTERTHHLKIHFQVGGEEQRLTRARTVTLRIEVKVVALLGVPRAQSIGRCGSASDALDLVSEARIGRAEGQRMQVRVKDRLAEDAMLEEDRCAIGGRQKV